MKFRHSDWREMDATKTLDVNQGRVHIMASMSVAVFAAAQGHEVLLGVGNVIDVTIAEELTLRVEAPAKAKVFIFDPAMEYTQPKGEVFTNIDRRPAESGSVLEVRKALREMQLNRLSFRREVRDERRKREAEQSEMQKMQQGGQAEETSGEAPPEVQGETPEAGAEA